MRTRTTIRLPDDLLREAKRAAAATNRTPTKVIEDSLRESLTRQNEMRASPKVSLPTFGSGGPRPGVDFADGRRLRDIMERSTGSALDVEGVDLDVTTDEIVAFVREGCREFPARRSSGDPERT